MERTAIDEQKAQAYALVVETKKSTQVVRCQHGYRPQSFIRWFGNDCFEMTYGQFMSMQNEIGNARIAIDF